MKGTLFITSDHGKAESMLDPQSGMPMTAHTTNDVPFLMMHGPLNGEKTEQAGIAADTTCRYRPFYFELYGNSHSIRNAKITILSLIFLQTKSKLDTLF